ncbi:MAG: uracil-DNA glycosylase [Rickettsiales bacterium]|jgi:hypothetical protein|nr:uracil-DNA glycosylase [Rickettsiales bacterium]
MEKYLLLLKNYKSSIAFNPWNESDVLHDIGEQAPLIREENLKKYLEQRENAQYLLIAEGLSYQGGHFTGIAMTSERQLLNDIDGKIFKGQKQRTSDKGKLLNKGLATLSEKGFTENTGTIVWNTLSDLTDSFNWINWNAFPFHPFKENNYLSNRTPVEKEVKEAEFFLDEFLKTFGQGKKIIAIGNYSELVLNRLKKDFIKVRHPANGGATKFRNQVCEYMNLCKK